MPEAKDVQIAPEPPFDPLAESEAASAAMLADVTKHLATLPKPEEKPVEPGEPEVKAVEAPKVEPPAIPPALLSRAKEMGWTEDEAREYGANLETAVGAAERTALRLFRQQKPEPKVEAPKEPEKKVEATDIWGGKREQVDESLVAAVEHLQASHTKELGELKAQNAQLMEYVQHQIAEEGRSNLDKIGDKLAEEGWAVYGKGRARQGSPEAQAKAKLGHLLAAERKAYRDLGVEIDLHEAAKIISKRLHGEPAQPTLEAPVEPKASPPKDPVTGRFMPPTPTARPTQRDSKPGPTTGRSAAIEAVRAHLSLNGNILGDVHDG